MSTARVVVWWAALDLARDPGPEVWAALRPEERAQAWRLPSRLRMREYAGARWLRARALADAAARTRSRGARGGPAFWSLAHEAGMAVVAIAAHVEVGVDAACVRGPSRPTADDLARAWPAAPPGEDALERWMRAEACAKLAGGHRAGTPAGVVFHPLHAGGDVAGMLATRGPAAVRERIVRLP